MKRPKRDPVREDRIHNEAIVDARPEERDDLELALLNPNVTVTKFHAESAFHDKEQLVFDIVMVPNKWAVEFHELDLLAVQFPCDSRPEGIREKGELFLEIDLFHAGQPQTGSISMSFSF